MQFARHVQLDRIPPTQRGIFQMQPACYHHVKHHTRALQYLTKRGAQNDPVIDFFKNPSELTSFIFPDLFQLILIGSGSKKSQLTSARIPTGELLSVWVSESEENVSAEHPLPLPLSLLLSSSSVFSLPPFLPLVLHHFGAGVRTQPSIGKLHPVFGSSSSCSSSKHAGLLALTHLN